MKQIKNKFSVFSDTYKMKTETTFHKDGQISVNPCSSELGKEITTNGSMVEMKAKVLVDKNGRTQVLPYRNGSGGRYRHLFKTKHGVVKETLNDLIIKLQFHKRKGRYDIADMLEDEAEDIINYIEITEDIKEWQ